jgi:peptidoglycan hydrolase-like protein with peptidoglycan-binding domain
MPLLRRGSQGTAIATLQAALNFYLPDLPPLHVDSVFGPKTEVRVKEFQRRNKLTPDGIVGPKTEAVIYTVAVLQPPHRC